MEHERIDALFTKDYPIIYPSVVLENPRFARNISMVIRILSSFMERANLFITTKRFYGSLDDDVKRLPREERMKGYNNINLVMEPMPLKKMNGTPVCIELVDGAVPLQYFEHPEDAIYIFGPEDGGVSKALRVQAHHFVIVPTRNCLNLATTVSIVMYDRLLKETLK